MENKLNKWFDAAKHSPPMISTKEVGAMISNPPAAKGGLSTLRKTVFMGTILLIVIGWLYWLNSIAPVDIINQQESTKLVTIIADDTLKAEDEIADFTKRL